MLREVDRTCIVFIITWKSMVTSDLSFGIDPGFGCGKGTVKCLLQPCLLQLSDFVT